jgi:hypothetical protein
MGVFSCVDRLDCPSAVTLVMDLISVCELARTRLRKRYNILASLKSCPLSVVIKWTQNPYNIHHRHGC